MGYVRAGEAERFFEEVRRGGVAGVNGRLTTEELARELGCSVRTVKRTVAEGRIQPLRVGRRLVHFDLGRVLERLSVEEETPLRRGRPRKRLVLGGGLRVANSP